MKKYIYNYIINIYNNNNYILLILCIIIYTYNRSKDREYDKMDKNRSKEDQCISKFFNRSN